MKLATLKERRPVPAMANFPIGGVPASRRRKTTFPRIIG